MTTTDLTAPQTTALAVAEIAKKAADYAEKARSSATRRAYALQWRGFEQWCAAHGAEALPAAPEVLAGFLADSASRGVKVPTLAQALAAISQAHSDAGLPNPRHDGRVRRVWSGVRNEHARNARQARPVTPDELRRLVKSARGLLGLRNRALLLLGFAGGFRRAELVGLDVEDLREAADGLIVRVAKSKTDQKAEGRDVGIPYGSDPVTCPVRAVRAWLTEAGLTAGPVFVGVRGGRLSGKRLDGRDVARCLQAAAKRTRTPRGGLSGHSLRAGLVTAAVKAGKSTRAIMDQTGHRSAAMIAKYTRAATLFDDNAAAGIGL